MGIALHIYSLAHPREEIQKHFPECPTEPQFHRMLSDVMWKTGSMVQ